MKKHYGDSLAGVWRSRSGRTSFFPSEVRELEGRGEANWKSEGRSDGYWLIRATRYYYGEEA